MKFFAEGINLYTYRKTILVSIIVISITGLGVYYVMSTSYRAQSKSLMLEYHNDYSSLYDFRNKYNVSDDTDKFKLLADLTHLVGQLKREQSANIEKIITSDLLEFIEEISFTNTNVEISHKALSILTIWDNENYLYPVVKNLFSQDTKRNQGTIVLAYMWGVLGRAEVIPFLIERSFYNLNDIENFSLAKEKLISLEMDITFKYTNALFQNNYREWWSKTERMFQEFDYVQHLNWWDKYKRKILPPYRLEKCEQVLDRIRKEIKGNLGTLPNPEKPNNVK